MQIPILRGVIDRRILVNYHVDPAVLAPLLPAPFQPKLVRGVGLVGICLIRLKKVRPRFLPGWLGISSENAAHRTAVEWDDQPVAAMCCCELLPFVDAIGRVEGHFEPKDEIIGKMSANPRLG